MLPATGLDNLAIVELGERLQGSLRGSLVYRKIVRQASGRHPEHPEARVPWIPIQMPANGAQHDTRLGCCEPAVKDDCFDPARPKDKQLGAGFALLRREVVWRSLAAVADLDALGHRRLFPKTPLTDFREISLPIPDCAMGRGEGVLPPAMPLPRLEKSGSQCTGIMIVTATTPRLRRHAR
jgi:hypothetical protein